jgi:hypothetical protein
MPAWYKASLPRREAFDVLPLPFQKFGKVFGTCDAAS